MARPSADAVFDTNILIDYLIGRDEAQQEFDRYPRRAISLITWMELQVGSQHPGEAAVVELFLREFRVIDITRQVARRAIEIRRHTRVRLPDAIIWATAQLESAVVVTRNTRDFPADDPGVRIPY
ncbi:MAG: type II toxin-antitoxin system VapC family toxin [Acidimicrobiia bacterium]|nr:type II toxin-antitoxin system VapC family toxin [Acidimicrobiia bacterium]